MRDRLTRLLSEVRIGEQKNILLSCILNDASIEAIADHLLANGVIAAPLKEGYVVFAVLRDFDGEDVIVEYEVSSVALISGKWWVFDKYDEQFEVGDELCLLTREEAEKALAESEGKG